MRHSINKIEILKNADIEIGDIVTIQVGLNSQYDGNFIYGQVESVDKKDGKWKVRIVNDGGLEEEWDQGKDGGFLVDVIKEDPNNYDRI